MSKLHPVNNLSYLGGNLKIRRFSQRQLRPFPVTAGSAAFAAVPLCREPGSRRSVQYIAVSIIFLLAIFKDGDGNIFLQLTGRRHIQVY